MNEEELLEVFREIMMTMIENIEELDLTKENSERLLLRRIRALLDQAGVIVTDNLPGIIAQSYIQGLEEGGEQLAMDLVDGGERLDVSSANAAAIASAAGVEVVREMDRSGALTNYLTSGDEEWIRPFPANPHVHAIAQIVDDSLLDFQAALRTAALNADRTITETLGEVRQAYEDGLVTGKNRVKMTKRVAEIFASKGMTAFVTVDNRRLPLDFYAMTVTRTKTRMATVAGSMARYEEMGQDLVKITENQDSCAICAAHDGLVVSLRGETEGFPVAGQDVQLPPYHPNCRGTVRPYVARVKRREEIEAELKRARDFDPEKDPRTPAQKRAYETEQRKRRIAQQENKMYANWKAVFGDRAPKNIGAFRRMKRQNTPRFQALMEEYNGQIRGGGKVL